MPSSTSSAAASAAMRFSFSKFIISHLMEIWRQIIGDPKDRSLRESEMRNGYLLDALIF